MKKDVIKVIGARQNNLKNLSINLPLNEFIVITGVSGSGKSSLAFDTVYAEGQRRYVETFSPYARQFLDRMDKPAVERIDGIPPAIAIDQTNPVRTSRSTVGTMTELNDHLKLLFARCSDLFCRQCAQPVRRDTPETVVNALLADKAISGARILLTFRINIPKNFSKEEILHFLQQQGYLHIHSQTRDAIEVIQDRVRLQPARRSRLIEAVEAALKAGHGKLSVRVLDDNDHEQVFRFSSTLHCAHCDIDYQQPVPNSFSFNSPMGACEACRGFGRVIAINYDLVVPDESKTLAEGAVRPWQTESYIECQGDLMRYARQRNIPVNKPWKALTQKQKDWVILGEGDWEDGVWYGVQRFFNWLESKAYKMHIRVLLSKYRAYNPCPACHGARLKPESLLWRLGSKSNADAVLDPALRFKPDNTSYHNSQLAELPGLAIHDVMLLPLHKSRTFFNSISLPAPLDEATDTLMKEIRARMNYLVDVGLGYLTLDRQSRTLSGGEVQRINLTTALGTSLVNTLFVLDEPSIGLHPRDIQRMVGILQRIRDAGNSLIVVEHDPQVMLSADKILDMGPGPGEHGGKKVFFGSPAELVKHKRSLTARYLTGEKQVSTKSESYSKPGAHKHITISNARAHNLKHIDVHIPLQQLVCITGVSGSGKSTLVQDVLYNALAKLKGKPRDTAGEHDAILGDEHIADIVLVDQSPIGKTTRSNPASYVGALEGIRKLFAAEPMAKERNYTAGTFSFNSGTGRCPTCSGNGFEHIEMQFLSDVYVRCPDCDGRRFRDEVLEVKVLPTKSGQYAASIADVLEMTVSEAVAFFHGHTNIAAALQPLADVGLAYLKLGQPVPTLSGGEAQRLKLAGHLARKTTKQDIGNDNGTLFLFDEPTTGLHFDDIAKLLSAFRQLLTAGHSLIVIEHNLDVINVADWIIDLGPEGGEDGGEIVFAGTLQQLLKQKPSNNTLQSYTARALRNYTRSLKALTQNAAKPAKVNTKNRAIENNVIAIHHAREHNLKNISLNIPRNQFSVITGISGSGKSTVAFDILFGEGQRRYLESLNAYARQFVQPSTRPDVDAIFGIPPTVAIEQRTSRGGRKSTVATLTEIYHFLRLLFVKLGTQYCPDCQVPIEPQSVDSIVAQIFRHYKKQQVTITAPLIVARKGYYTDLAKWALSKGYEILRVDGEALPTDNWPRLDRYREHDIDLPLATLQVKPATETQLREALHKAVEMGNGIARLIVNNNTARGKGKKRHNEVIYSTKRACPSCARSFDELDPRLFSFNSKHGWCESCYGTGLQIKDFDADQTGEEIWWNEWFEGEESICPSCEGKRLNPEALSVYFKDHNIAELTELPIARALATFSKIKLRGREAEIAHGIVSEMLVRLKFLNQVGLSYLSLDRSAPTLSGGEAQRIRLAAQLGSNLRGVCYILDEPTIGLHARDNRLLINTLVDLKHKGNTVVVVEHDEDTIRRADHVMDLGPGAGKLGGQLVAQGTLAQLRRNKRSITGQYLRKPLQHPLIQRRKVVTRGNHKTPLLHIQRATLNNLKNLSVALPLQKLVCISGVSGSGKSSLIRQVLHDNLQQILSRKRRAKRKLQWYGCEVINGWQAIDRLLEVDQTPIGKTPRSCPATYIGFFDDIRNLFAATTEANIRGYRANRFSFNVKGGRCDACEGQGYKKVEMSFLPDVKVPCDVCNGLRFSQDTLEILYRGRNIGEVLAMSVDEAVDFFQVHNRIHHALTLLQDVGLGYLTLGQHSPTLSGGEAQRIKLVTELAKAKSTIPVMPADTKPGRHSRTRTQHTLYILDEPTIGLHMADVEKLIRVLHRLVDVGNTVIVIEHNLDVLAEADWLIDLGPEGGDKGGRVIARGTPEDVAYSKQSYTAQFLQPMLLR